VFCLQEVGQLTEFAKRMKRLDAAYYDGDFTTSSLSCPCCCKAHIWA
jgi:hypothetical protein